jgi:hypothetical protein
MYYLEELAQNLSSNSVPSSSPKEERSMKGNIMSGMSLYKRLLVYRHIFEQKVQTLFPGFQGGDGDFFSELRGKGGRVHHNY